jgi:type II secretory pathway pseudopilin PulG
MKSFLHRRAFTLLEIIVVLGIIVMFLALIVPALLRWREGGRSQACLRNMQRIGKAVLDYAKDNGDKLPGPLTVDQYPVQSAGNPPRDGQMLKHIARYLEQPANSADGRGNAKTLFTFPAWERAEHTTDSPVFLVNTETVHPFGQPAWGGGGKEPLKLGQLAEWTRKIGEVSEPLNPSKIWALTEADQEVAKLLGLDAPWVSRMPSKAVHVTHRAALYFDWHAEELTLSRTQSNASMDKP